MIDFPIMELLDDSHCLVYLERHLHPDGLQYPHCGSMEAELALAARPIRPGLVHHSDRGVQ